MTRYLSVILLVLLLGVSASGNISSSQSIISSNGGAIQGIIRSDEGLPIADARVLFITEQNELVDSAFSNINGFFEKNLESGKYFVSAGAFNYCRKLYPNAYLISSADLIEISSNEIVEISLVLERGGSISGAVVSGSYDPIEFFITAIKMGSPYNGWSYTERYLIYGADEYCLSGLIPGNYKIFIRANAYRLEYYPGVELAQEADIIGVTEDLITGDIDFYPIQPGTSLIRGFIGSSANQPLSGAEISAYQWEDPASDPNKVIALSEADGTYELEVTGGYYFISAEVAFDDYTQDRITVYHQDCYDPALATSVRAIPGQIVDGIEFDIDFTLSYNLQIFGTLVNEDSGLPVEGARLTALDYFTGQAISSAISNRNGDFIIYNLISGIYIIEITGSGLIPSFWPDVFSWQQAETVVLYHDSNILHNGGAITQDYGTPGFEITGQVYGLGEPLADVRVYAFNLDNATMTYARTGSDGSYCIASGLQEGDYSIFADKYGWEVEYFPYPITLDLISNPEVDDINFDMIPVTVSIDDGQPTLPEKTRLLGNFPNPFNNSTTIMFTSARYHDSEIEIYNLLGQMVNSLPVSVHPGVNMVFWNGRGHDNGQVSSGIYFYRIKDLPETRKMVLLK